MEPKDICFKHPVHFLAYGFGSGLAPKAPGTFGTLAALVLFIPLSCLSAPVYLTVVVIAGLVGIYICDKAANDLGVHDHGSIVWDEFVGLWIALAAVPSHWVAVLLGFVLFRLFDILKPWPIAFLDERVEGGFGIMVDDVIAGFYAFGILHLILYIFGL